VSATTPATKTGEIQAAAGLQASLRAVRRQLAVREQALAVLNRRLLRLESGEIDQGGTETMAAEVASLSEANRALKEELYWLRHSRVFRWSSPLRKAYHTVRRR